MSNDERIKQYGSIFEGWKFDRELYHSSDNKTIVYKIYRINNGRREENALKSVNVITEAGKFDRLSNEFKISYEKAKEERCALAEQEVKLMKRLNDCEFVVKYLNYCFSDWQEETQFGCDLLIQMELLCTLRDTMKCGKIYSEKEVLSIGKNICSALIICHKERILHRDIKPDNIFERQGKYLLGDFGISKIVDSSYQAVTRKGTLEYMAPEQFGQLREKYDTRIDIYSLGLTLYELCNHGKLPFAANIHITYKETERRLVGEKIPEIKGINSKLSDIILKACQYKAENRYQTAEELLHALNSVQLQEITLENKYETIDAEDVKNIGKYGRYNDNKEESKKDIFEIFDLSPLYIKLLTGMSIEQLDHENASDNYVMLINSYGEEIYKEKKNRDLLDLISIVSMTDKVSISLENISINSSAGKKLYRVDCNETSRFAQYRHDFNGYILKVNAIIINIIGHRLNDFINHFNRGILIVNKAANLNSIGIDMLAEIIKNQNIVVLRDDSTLMRRFFRKNYYFSRFFRTDVRSLLLDEQSEVCQFDVLDIEKEILDVQYEDVDRVIINKRVELVLDECEKILNQNGYVIEEKMKDDLRRIIILLHDTGKIVSIKRMRAFLDFMVSEEKKKKRLERAYTENSVDRIDRLIERALSKSYIPVQNLKEKDETYSSDVWAVYRKYVNNCRG